MKVDVSECALGALRESSALRGASLLAGAIAGVTSSRGAEVSETTGLSAGAASPAEPIVAVVEAHVWGTAKLAIH